MNFAFVPDYEGLYIVSSDGSIYSVERKGNKGKNRKLTGGTDQNGYRVVCLTKNGKQKTVRVHRIVAKAFVPNPNGFCEVNHKDENKTNNCADNLEWCNRKYNVNYGKRTDKTKKSVMQFDENGNFIQTYAGVREAANAIGALTCGGISNCCNKKSKTAYGYIWRYEN